MMLRLIVCSGLLALMARGAFGQSSPPAFDVASIKPTPLALQNQLRIDRCISGGRYFSGGAPLSWTIAWGFRVPDTRITGVPEWVESFSAAYEIEARAACVASSD
jgi:uncharacterized protein (TIGR03435 family)